ncbi:hypothetical protein V3481_012819 [Fusarium oxysporum f. sp. vasinfectum]
MQGKCLHFGETRSSKDLDSLFHYVYLQTWASGPGRQFWIVKRNGNQQRPIGGDEVQNHLRLVCERQLQHKQPGLPLSAHHMSTQSINHPNQINQIVEFFLSIKSIHAFRKLK